MILRKYKTNLSVAEVQRRVDLLADDLVARYGLREFRSAEGNVRLIGKIVVVAVDATVITATPGELAIRIEDPGPIWRRRVTTLIDEKARDYLTI